jgi:hypothetical protein
MLRYCLAILLTSVTASLARTQEPPLDFRRIEVAADQLTPEMRRQQVLVPLLRKEFEALVERARSRGQSQQHAAQLVAASYAARLHDNGLLGTGCWTVHKPGPEPVFFRFQPCNLAIVKPPLLDGQPAVFGDSGADAAGVWFTAEGSHRLCFEWSARPDVRPDGLWFFLQTPAAPVAVLDLEVPADRVVECPGHRPALLPGDASAPGYRRWRLVFGSSKPADLEILVRPLAYPSRPGLAWAAVSTTLTLSPAGCDARFLIEVRTVHQRLDKLRLELTGPMEVLEVQRVPRALPPLLWRRGAGDDAAIEVLFPEPVERQATFEVRCHCPLPAAGEVPARFLFPGLRVLSAWHEPERIRVRIFQTLGLSQWELGDFRLGELAGSEREGSDVFEVVELVQTAAAALAPQRPSALVRLSAAQTDVTQESWWQLGQGDSVLEVVTRWQVRQGPVFRLEWQLPASAQVEEAELIGSNTTAAWRVEPDQRLSVELREPAASRSTVVARIRLRLPATREQVVKVPAVVPRGARILECGLAVSGLSDPSLPDRPGEAPRLEGTAAVLRPLPAGPDKPWAAGTTQPQVYYVHRGDVVRGHLVWARPAPVFATIETQVRLADEQVVVDYAWLVQAAQPSAEGALSLRFSGRASDLDWEVGEAAGDFTVTRSAAPDAQGDRWDLHWKDPPTAPRWLKARLKLPRNRTLNLPLPYESGSDHRLVLSPEAAQTYHIEGQGLEPEASDADGYLQCRYGRTPPQARLLLRQSQAAETAAVPLLDAVQVTTWIRRSAGLLHVYEAEVHNPQPAKLPFTLPPRCCLESLEIGDARMAADASEGLEIPLPAGRTLLRIVYRSETPERWGAWQVRIPMPRWQGKVQEMGYRHRFHLERGLRLLYPTADASRQPGRDVGAAQDRDRPGAIPGSDADADRRDGRDGSTVRGAVALRLDAVLVPALNPRANPAWAFVVEAWCLHGAGFLLAGVAVVVAWLAGPLRWKTLLWILGGLGLLLIWVPSVSEIAWWLLGGTAVAGFVRRRSSAPSPVASASLAVVVAAAAWFGAAVSQGLAQSAAAPVVFLLREPDRPAEEARVLVPEPLLRQLRGLAEEDRHLPKAVFLQAQYGGRVGAGAARLTAVYEIEVIGPPPFELVLPLTGIRLEKATVDGAAALLSPLGPEGGFLLRLETPGRHRVELTLHASLRSERDVHELRLGIPPVSTAHLRLELPAEISDAHVVGIRGRSWTEPGHQQREAVLLAELGKTGELLVRWYHSPPDPSPANVRETFLFDLSSQDLRLQAAWRIESARRHRLLRVAVPPGLEVQTVELRGDPEASPPPRLRNWRVEAGEGPRILTVEPLRPAPGNCVLLVGFVLRPDALPVLPPDQPWKVKLPRLVDAAHRETLVALRVTQLSLSDVKLPAGMTPVSDTSASVRARLAELGSVQGPVVAAAGQNVEPLEVVLSLRPQPPELKVSQTTHISADLPAAEVRSAIEVVVSRGAIGMLTLRLAEDWMVTDVHGPDVHRWQVDGPAVEVWLKKPVTETTRLNVTAWLPVIVEDAQVCRLQVSGIGFGQAVTVTGTVEASVPGGWTLEPVSLEGLSALETQEGLAFRIERPDHRGVFRLQRGKASGPADPPPAQPTPRAGAEPQGDRPSIAVLAAFRRTILSENGLYAQHDGFLIRMSGSPDFAVSLPSDVQVHEARYNGSLLDLPPVQDSTLRLVLPERQGVGYVELTWSGGSGSSARSQREIRVTRPAPAGQFPAVWQVQAPPTWTVAAPGLGLGWSASDADYHLAAAQLWLSGLQEFAAAFPPGTEPHLASARTFLLVAGRRELDLAQAALQQRFDASSADQWARLQADWQTLADWYGEDASLLAFLARQMAVERSSRAEATPLRLVTDADPTSLRLVCQEKRWSALLQSLLATAMLGGLGGVLALLSLEDRQFRWVGEFWPEVLVLAGGLAWIWSQGAMFPALVCLAGLAARGRAWLRRLWPTESPAIVRPVSSSMVRGRPGQA